MRSIDACYDKLSREQNYESSDKTLLVIIKISIQGAFEKIITLQSDDRILLKYIVLETGVHPLQDGLYIV